MKCDTHGPGCFRAACGYEPPYIKTDPIRRAYLNRDLEGHAGRRLGMFLGGGDGQPGMERDAPRFVEAPKDSFEARHIEKQFGIKFVGDDTSSLKPQNQKAIERVNEMRRQGEPV